MLKEGSKFVLVAVRIAIVAIVVSFLYGLVSFYLFGGNFLGMEEPSVAIEEIDIATGDTVTPDILLGWLEMEHGSPLFAKRRGFLANDLRQRRSRAMANPTLSSLSISRRYTGKVWIRATERTPVARIGSRNLAIDSQGNVFAFRKAGIEGLVSIEGGVPSSLEAGCKVVPLSLDASREALAAKGRFVPSAMTVAALRLVDCMLDGSSPIPLSTLRAINVDSGDYLKLFFKDGKTVKLSWDCMKSSLDTDGKEYLEAQLLGLQGVMSSRAGRGLRNFDFTVKGHGYGQ